MKNTFNPFTVMFAAPSLGKRPIKVKFETIFLFFPFVVVVVVVVVVAPFALARERFLSKRTVSKVDLLQDHQIYCLHACMCAFLSPEILYAGAVKGIIHSSQQAG